MTALTFVAADGTETLIEATEGESVMMAAIRNGVAGILGECGGSLACCTCHVYIEDALASTITPISDFENDMLDMTASPREAGSRLGCQIEVGPALEGARIRMPEAQI